jgi:hypothetical protein
VKRSITYREITVAIGVIVAMVIALSLWMGLPGSEVSGTNAHPVYDLPSSARTFVLNISTDLFEQSPPGLSTVTSLPCPACPELVEGSTEYGDLTTRYLPTLPALSLSK